MHIFLSIMVGLLALIFAAPCLAQQANSSAAQGDPYHATNLTQAGAPVSSNATGQQSVVNLPTGFGQLANVPGGLPETRLDSLVKDSGYNDLIYGDEGIDGPPPYNGFTDEHYIYHGMSADTGLTTGHASVLDTAWGYTNTLSNGPGVSGDFAASSIYSSTTGVPLGYDSGYGNGYTTGTNVNGYSLGYTTGYVTDPATGVTNTTGAPVNLAGTQSGF